MLKQNGSIFAQYPLRHFGGALADTRQLWGRTELRNAMRAESLDASKAAIPNGHLNPSAWVLPEVAGGLSAYTSAGVAFSLGAANLAAGRNVDGSTSVTFSVPSASLELVVSASGSATVTFTPSATLAGALSASGSSAVTFTVTPATLGAIINALASSSVTFSGSATATALGNLAGAITPFTELSPQSLASAVWAALSADNNATGTMGRLLNSAGGAADPDAIAAAVWAAVSRTLTGTTAANVTQVNGITVDGAGTEADPWGPA